MKQAVVRKFKWFWPWQDDLEEAWLEQMSQQGLHLKQAHIGAQYDFIPGAPQQYTYRLDFQDSLKGKKNEGAYLRIFSDAGWEHLGQMGGWQYFRRPSTAGVQNEIFTDSDSKIQKYNRYLTYLGLTFPSYLVVFVALWGEWPEWMMWLNVGIIFLFAAFTGVVTVKVNQRIKQLKSL